MREIQHRIHDIYGFAVFYRKVSRGHKKTVDAINGPSKEMFSMFPRLETKILKTNPNNILDLATDNENRFLWFFFYLKDSIDGFLEGS